MITGAFLVCGGVALGLGGAWFVAKHIVFLDWAERGDGEVVAIAKERGAKGTPIHFAIVRYRPVEGDDAVELKARPGLWPSPEEAMIVSFWTLWFLPGVMVLFGVACLVAGRSTWAKAA